MAPSVFGWSGGHLHIAVAVTLHLNPTGGAKAHEEDWHGQKRPIDVDTLLDIRQDIGGTPTGSSMAVKCVPVQLGHDGWTEAELLSPGKGHIRNNRPANNHAREETSHINIMFRNTKESCVASLIEQSLLGYRHPFGWSIFALWPLPSCQPNFFPTLKSFIDKPDSTEQRTKCRYPTRRCRK